MTERASVFDGHQIGVESVAGTAVAASKRLLDLGFEFSPSIPREPFTPHGRKAPTVVIKKKEGATGSIADGSPLSYNSFVYLAASNLCAPVITTPDGATLTRRWTFTPELTEPDDVKTFTIQKGSRVGAEQIVYAFLNSMGLKVNEDNVSISGELLGQGVTDEIQLSTNEQQTITLVADSGTFTISYAGQTTSALAWNAAASAVEDALEALSTIGVGNVVVTKVELVYTLEFRGDLAQQNITPVTTYVGNINEQQTITVDATSGTFKILYDSSPTGDIAFDASAATVETALDGIVLLGAGSTAVTKNGSVYTIEFTGDFGGMDCLAFTTDVTSLVKGGGAGTAVVATTVPGVAPTLLLVAAPGTATVATSVPGVAPTDVPEMPVSPTEASIYCAADEAGLSAGKLTRCLDWSLDVNERFAVHPTIDAAETAWTFAAEKSPSLDGSLVVEKDSTAIAMIGQLRNATKRFMQILCTGSLVEAGFPHRIEITFPFVFLDDEEEDVSDVFGCTFGFTPVYDSVFGGWMKVVVDNALTAL